MLTRAVKIQWIVEIWVQRPCFFDPVWVSSDGLHVLQLFPYKFDQAFVEPALQLNIFLCSVLFFLHLFHGCLSLGNILYAKLYLSACFWKSQDMPCRPHCDIAETKVQIGRDMVAVHTRYHKFPDILPKWKTWGYVLSVLCCA